MPKKYQAPGEFVEFTAPTGGVTKDVGVKIGDLLVIPQSTQLLAEKFIGLRLGVVEHDKLTAQAWTEGQQVNWDDVNKRFTTVTTSNFKAGVAARAAANPTPTGFVILSGVNLGAVLA
jgi:predicted RecA/RadA family phage recombinase